MDQDKVEIILNKIFPTIKPEEVLDIMFDVRHTAPNEFTLYTRFIVPEKWFVKNYPDNLVITAFPIIE